MKATPGWGNNKPPDSNLSAESILLLIGVALSVIVVALGKTSLRRRK